MNNRMGVRAGLVVVLTAVALMAMPGASAASSGGNAAGSYFPISGPALAGDGVVWAQYRADGGFVLRRGALDGGAVRTVVRSPKGDPEYVSGVRIAASSEELLVQHRVFARDNISEPFFDPIDRGTLRVSASGKREVLGPACRLEACGGRAADLSGGAGIFPGPDVGTARIRDFAEPESAAFTVTDVTSLPRIAGRYAAWSSERDVVVFDRVTRSVAYRLVDLVEPAARVLSLDVQDDGTVAVAFRQGSAGWASVSEPFLHQLPLPADDSYSVKIHGGVIAYLSTDGNVPSTRATLGTIDLAGRGKALVRPVEGDTFLELFDFDGQRLAWVERTCSGPRVRVADTAALVQRPRLQSREGTCRLRLTGKPRVTRAGGLRLELSCVGFSRACDASGISVRTARPYRAGRRRLRRGTLVAASKRGSSDGGPVSLRTRPAGRGLLRRRGPIRLVVRAEVFDGLVAERRRTQIVLR